MDFRNRPVDPHRFSMIPRAEIPRARFLKESMHKTTFDAGYLIPVFLDEVLPGDHFVVDMTYFARLSTPLFPIMDNLTLSTFWFFVPNRLVWTNWQRFMGERDPDPDSSIDYLVPQLLSPVAGFDPCSIFDYFGLPTVGQISAVGDVSWTQNALPLRMYNLIWNEWFRDENLQDSVTVHRGDGPDPYADYQLLRRGKRHDYFTSCLPWPQKGDSVQLPLGSTAPVIQDPLHNPSMYTASDPVGHSIIIDVSGGMSLTGYTGSSGATAGWVRTGMVADLSSATAATINQIRQSFQVQRLLERDARGGTRYTEILRSHFGVISPDARLQRPEYLGGGTFPVNINPVAQTSATALDGGDTPLANLAAIGTSVGHSNGFTQSFVEHGYVIGLVSVQADLSYQQGLRKLWSRKTRYDFYFPVFAHLGEQAVLNREIYITGIPAQDEAVFGYQERWAEYRYHPSMITGMFRSTTADTIDAWHLSQRFTSLPTLNATFIQDTPPVSRILAVGDAQPGQQIIFDSLFRNRCTRPMPLYSVPGLVDHF